MCFTASPSVFAITLAGIDFPYRIMNSERLHRRLVSRQDSLPVAHAKPTPGKPQVPSLHMVAEIDQQLVGGFEANQARTRVLDVEHHVDDDYREDCEAENV